MYELENLIKTFEENAILCKKENERLKDKFVEENPGDPVPEWFTKDFCINTALASMCREIQSVKEQLKR